MAETKIDISWYYYVALLAQSHERQCITKRFSDLGFKKKNGYIMPGISAITEIIFYNKTVASQVERREEFAAVLDMTKLPDKEVPCLISSLEAPRIFVTVAKA